jgi:hypothetical protein
MDGRVDGGRDRCNVDEEADAPRLTTLELVLLATRLESILYAGVDASTGLLVSCGSNGGRRLEGDGEDAAEVEAVCV